MSLPPALLQRLAQRGLVTKQKKKSSEAAPAEKEEVIAEDYDEMEAEEQQHGPEGYEHIVGETRKRTEENFWLERMKARMGEGGSAAGYKGCPNKYNIWHKCTLFCVNRWAEGHPEPGRDYMRRYKRLLRKYPLPKGWTEMYDPGCGCFYFHNAVDSVVSWLPPTHPKSQVSRTAASYRRQMEDANGEGGAGAGSGGSDGEQMSDDADDEEHESSVTRHQREIDEIISASMRARSPVPTVQNFSSSKEVTVAPPRKQKSRDLDRAISRQRRDRDKERERHHPRRHGRDADALDPMDPSAYSDTPRGKWSDGLPTGGGDERKKANGAGEGKERGSAAATARERRAERSDEEDDE